MGRATSPVTTGGLSVQSVVREQTDGLTCQRKESIMDFKKLLGNQLTDSLVAVMDVMGFSSVLKKNSGIF